MKQNSFYIFTDGGALGNPGPAGVGVVVRKGKRVVQKISRFIGRATNNIAEYQAVIEALKWLKKENKRKEKVYFFLDSKLVVNQLNGLFKVKNANLRRLIVKVRELERDAGGSISYFHIPREKNQEADSLVKEALAAC